MESFFSQLKEEALRHYHNPTFAQVQELIGDYIRFYTYERIQLKTKLTPYERRCQFACPHTGFLSLSPSKGAVQRPERA